MKKIVGLACFLILVLSVFAFGQRNPGDIPQPPAYIKANISGGGGSGKCTFEVVIDGAADVQIRGAEGRLVWVGGGAMSWKRLDCNQPMPRNPNNFQFHGVDGRGTQRLLRNPNGNNGVAVIRLDDPQKGSEAYTGDITWNGGSGTWNGGGDWNSGGDWNNAGDWNSGGNNGGNNNGGWQTGNWSSRVIPNCQRAIRNQLVPQFGGYLTWRDTPSANKAGAFVLVQGAATYRDGSGKTGDISYSCTVHPNGNVTDAKYKTLDNYRPTPR